MGPIKAVGSVLGNYFNFSGRASRSEFWWWALAQPLIIGAAVAFDITRMMKMDPEVLANVSPQGTELMWVLVTPWLSLAFFIPSLAVSIRRLHDIGRSGLWYLLMLVPLIGPLVLLVFWVFPSENMHNKWGAPPNGGGHARDDRPMQMPALSGLPANALNVPPEEISNFYRKRVLGEA